MKQWIQYWFAVSVALAVGGCRSCDNPLISDLVTVTYRQLYNFSEWEVIASDGSVFSRGKIEDGVYMRYRIVSISNTDKQPKLFHFDPNRIHTSDASERPSLPVIGLSGALAFDVPPGTVRNNLNLTIKVKGSPAQIREEIRLLFYDSGLNEHVLMVNEDPKATTAPYRNPLRIPGPNLN